MKLVKTFIIVACISISLKATEVKPFGDFNFGDTITPVYEKLCKLQDIKTIKLGFSKEVKKSQFCKSKEEAFKMIKESSKPKYRPSNLNKVNIKGFENIARYNLFIRAKGVNIKGVDFQLILHMGTYRDEQTAGSYLRTSNDILKIDNLYVPLELDEVQLKPMSYSEFKLHKGKIFNILWEKYKHLVNPDSKEQQYSRQFIKVNAKDKTILTFGGSDGIIYNAEFFLDKFRSMELNKYINENTSKNDSSDKL